MSEFTEVMRHARQICKTTSCFRCPLVMENGTCMLSPIYANNYAEVERRIMTWAAEHPDIEHFSWREGWIQLFPRATDYPCPNSCFGLPCPINSGEVGNCDECYDRPISRDVAETLGIKIKEE